MSFAIANNSIPTTPINEPASEVNNNNISPQAPQTTSSSINQSANYSEAQTANFFAQTQKSILFAKLSTSNREQQSNNTASNRPSGVTVKIEDVKNTIKPNEAGKRAANQGIRTTYEVESNGAKRPLTADEINARQQRDRFLKLTDDKGNLTPLGKQFDQFTTNGPAVVTELGTDIHQLATLVNGSKPSPEREATILAGLVSSGLASVAVDANGKVSFAVVPYRVASNSQIIAAGEQAKTDFENIKAILPGLKDTQGIVSLGASIYAATVVGVAAAPAGLLASTAASGLAAQTTDNLLKDGRLPTTQEAATSIVLSLALAGGGLVAGKIINNIRYGEKLTEIPLSVSTQARNTEKEVSKIITIFGDKAAAEATTSKPTSTTITENNATPVADSPSASVTNKTTAEAAKAEVNGIKAAAVTEAEVAEQAAKAEASRLEQLDGGHSIDRHGPEVPLNALEKRLKTGIAPDNKISFAPASTRFNNYDNLLKTRQNALKEIETKYNVDLSKPPSPNDRLKHEITVEYDKAIDDGYVPDLSTKQKITATDPVTGKTKDGKVFSSVDFIEGVRGTYTKVAWDNNQNKWIVVQHFPVTDNWDNVAKAYTKPLMVKSNLP